MTVESHPQRAEIIAALTDTTRRISMRQLAASLNPPVHQATLSRFRAKVIGNVAATMRGKNSNINIVKNMAAMHGTEEQALTRREEIREELQQSVAADRRRYEKWLADAESTQDVDPVTGVVTHNMDHASLARHARNSLSAVELSAKLAGLLQTDAGVAAAVQVVVMPAGAHPSEPEGQVIDISATR